MTNNITDEWHKLNDFLTERGYPNNDEVTLVRRVRQIIDDNKPNFDVIDLQIRYTALYGRLEPYMAKGEQPSETLSRLLRYTQQLEQTNCELRQQLER